MPSARRASSSPPLSRTALQRTAMIFATIALLGTMGGWHAAAFARSPVEAHSQTSGVFNLRNTGTAGVHVEVRVGMAEECEGNDLLVRAELPAGGVWRIAGDVPVCWRELVARGTDGALVPAGGWSRRTVARGATADVVLTGPTSDDAAPE